MSLYVRRIATQVTPRPPHQQPTVPLAGSPAPATPQPHTGNYSPPRGQSRYRGLPRTAPHLTGPARPGRGCGTAAPRGGGGTGHPSSGPRACDCPTGSAPHAPALRGTGRHLTACPSPCDPRHTPPHHSAGAGHTSAGPPAAPREERGPAHGGAAAAAPAGGGGGWSRRSLLNLASAPAGAAMQTAPRRTRAAAPALRRGKEGGKEGGGARGGRREGGGAEPLGSRRSRAGARAACRALWSPRRPAARRRGLGGGSGRRGPGRAGERGLRRGPGRQAGGRGGGAPGAGAANRGTWSAAAAWRSSRRGSAPTTAGEGAPARGGWWA